MTAITRTPDHHYIFEGVTYPGVTSILKVIDKSGPLMAWASRKTAEAALGLLPSLATLVETVGPDGALRALTARSGWERDKSAASGTEIHGLADALVSGRELPADTDAVTAHRVGRYADWYAGSRWTLRASEALLINPGLGYGGTLDLLAYDENGVTVLADLKTGKDVYREAIIQLAAYGMAQWLELASGELYVMPAIERYCVLHLGDEGVRVVDVTVHIHDAEQAFAHALGLSAWQASTKEIARRL